LFQSPSGFFFNFFVLSHTYLFLRLPSEGPPQSQRRSGAVTLKYYIIFINSTRSGGVVVVVVVLLSVVIGSLVCDFASVLNFDHVAEEALVPPLDVVGGLGEVWEGGGNFDPSLRVAFVVERQAVLERLVFTCRPAGSMISSPIFGTDQVAGGVGDDQLLFPRDMLLNES
jgi:hypothetical protein